MNPFDGIAHFFLGLLQEKKIQAWYRLIFGLVLSGLLSFLFVCGGLLVSLAPAKQAIGAGMVMAAAMMLTVYRRSELSKGITLAIPATLAKKEMETDKNIIERT